jgi:allantoin racemase
VTRVLWINPIGTDKFDEPLREELERAKRPGTDVEVRSLSRGPHHLEYHAYEAAVVPDVLSSVIQAEREGFDAAVIGCFYDTGLRAAREVATRIAVVAPCESALHIGATLGDSFSVVVGRRKWVPEMRDNVFRYGFRDRLASFKVVELGVHDFQVDPDLTRGRLAAVCEEALHEDGAEVVILGCTIEYGFFSELQETLGAPVVDATVAPLKYAELLGEASRLGWRPSKIGGYAAPPPAELEAFGLAEELSVTATTRVGHEPAGVRGR